MTKSQCLYNFWSGFSIPAYEENSIPDEAVLPYITYQVITDGIGAEIGLVGSVWYDDTSVTSILAKSQEIANKIGRGGIIRHYTGGAMWIKRGIPFAQLVSQGNDDKIKQVIIQLDVEFLSED